MFQVATFLLLLCFFQCQAVVEVQKDFDIHKFSGQWYGIAAASNCEMFNKMKKDMTLPIIVYAVDQDNTVKFSVAYKTPKGCQQMDGKYETISNGHYKHVSKFGDNEIMIVGTDYDSFALESTKTVHKDMSCISNKLYGRKMNLPDDIKHKFVEHCKAMGLMEDDMLMFKKGGECVPHAF